MRPGVDRGARLFLQAQLVHDGLDGAQAQLAPTGSCVVSRPGSGRRPGRSTDRLIVLTFLCGGLFALGRLDSISLSTQALASSGCSRRPATG